MPLIHADFVEEISQTTGTGTLTLDGATQGHRSFASAIGEGNTCIYAIYASDGNRETGVGTVTGSTLERTTFNASSTGSALDLPAGPHRVYCTFSGEGGEKTYGAEPAIARNTAFNKDFGVGADDVCEGNDSRLGQAESALQNVEDDTAPVLGGHLTIGGSSAYDIVYTDQSGTVQGLTGAHSTEDAIFFAKTDILATYDDNDGGILAKSGGISLHGATLEIPTLMHSDDAGYQEMRVSSDGYVFAASPPTPGWNETDTSSDDVTAATDNAWVQVTGLSIVLPADVASDAIIDVTTKLYVSVGNKAETLAFGIGIDNAEPAASGQSATLVKDFEGYITFGFSSANHDGGTVGQHLQIWIRTVTGQVAIDALGSVQPHSLLVSVPGGGSTGGGDMQASLYDPQNIQNDAFARANHTGTQTLSTISDAGTAAASDASDFQAVSEKAQADGYAPLDANVEVPTLHLPLFYPAAVSWTRSVSESTDLYQLGYISGSPDWVALSALTITVPRGVRAGTVVAQSTALWLSGSGPGTPEIAIGVGINGAQPTHTAFTKSAALANSGYLNFDDGVVTQDDVADGDVLRLYAKLIAEANDESWSVRCIDGAATWELTVPAIAFPGYQPTPHAQDHSSAGSDPITVPRRAVTPSSTTWAVELDNGAYTYQCDSSYNLDSWSAVIPTGGSATTEEWTASIDFVAPASAAWTMTVPAAWHRMSGAEPIAFAGGEEPVSVVLRQLADGTIQYYRSDAE